MESMSSDTEEESNDANCNELSQDFLISAGSEADSQGSHRPAPFVPKASDAQNFTASLDH